MIIPCNLIFGILMIQSLNYKHIGTKGDFLNVKIYEAIELILENTHQLKSEIIPLENAIFRVCAEDLAATVALPPFNNSAMDGYALYITKGHTETGDEFPVIGKILAGDKQTFTLEKNQAVKITTGAKVPQNTNCIIPQEYISPVNENVIQINKKLRTGANIRNKGEDIQIGDIIIYHGKKIEAPDIALLASQGITHIKVYKKPKVTVFGSGKELKLHYESLQSSQVYNSNTPSLLARAKELGCEVSFIGKAEDDIESIQELITSSLDSNLIITSGGISVGEADFTKDAFKTKGCKTIFTKVAIKPGKPTTFGKIGDTLILNLPGNPLASALNFEIFGSVIIAKLSGIKTVYTNYIETKIAEDFDKNRPVDTVIPGFFNGRYFHIAEKFGAGMVNVLNHCNGFVILGATIDSLKKDDMVKFIPIFCEFKSENFVDFIN